MGFGSEAVKCVVVLATLITLSTPHPVVHSNSTEIPKLTKREMTQYRLLYNNIEPSVPDSILTASENISGYIDIMNPNWSLNRHNEKRHVTCENSTKFIDPNEKKLSPKKHNDDDELVHLKLKLDYDHSDVGYSLSYNYKNAENVDTYDKSNGVIKTHDSKPVLSCWDKPDFMTRVCVSMERMPNDTATMTEPSKDKITQHPSANNLVLRLHDRNNEPSTDGINLTSPGKMIDITNTPLPPTQYAENSLVLCKDPTKFVVSNGTTLIRSGNNGEDGLSLRLGFDQDNPDGTYSLNLKYKDAETMDANDKFKDIMQISQESSVLPCWDESELEARVRLTIEYSPNDMGSTETKEDKMIRYRLPNNTIPRVYDIQIEPNMDDENFTWSGKISIDIEVMSSTSVLTLHAYKNLVIDENVTTLIDINGITLIPVKHNYDDEVEFLKLEFDHEIPVGKYKLNLEYSGAETIDTDDESKDFTDLSGAEFVRSQVKRIPDGFYRISQNANYIIAGTHFEATTARRAFPCWDEPGVKARFRLTIKHFSNYTAISNMPEIERVESSDGKILTIFDTTPIMSTYLLTFVISDYETAFNGHRNVSLHTSKQALKEAMHLLDLSPQVVKVMESYTGFPFGVPRVGSVLLPVYSTPATEHWGLVSYSESMIRFDPTIHTIKQQDFANTLIAHELSHSWFGNRVTPLWWNDLWLNEAFATYFQYYIMDQVDENWRAVELFVVSINQESAFPNDNDASSPVRWTPITNAEIAKMFGPMVYAKGAAILHMFRNVLGDNVFRAGIQKYMANHSFAAATAEDLMFAFQEAYDENSNKTKPLDLREAMTPWLVQNGYPMINVIRNYITGETEVSQKSTIIDSSNTWWIPLTHATKSNPNFASTLPTRWISDKEDHVKIDGINKDDWIILNVQASGQCRALVRPSDSGYYRINYDDENWKRLAEYLNTDDYRNIHVLNRAQLISDSFYLVQREPKRYFKTFYRLTEYLSREVDYLPWRSAYYAIIQIEGVLRNTEVHKMFVKYILKLMHSYVDEVGFEVQPTDDHFTKLSRIDVVQLACRFGHTGCAEHAAQKLINLAANPVDNRLHPDTVNFMYCAGLRGLKDTEAIQFAKWAYENARDLFIANVYCTENHEIHENIFQIMLAEDTANLDEPYRLFTYLVTSTDENFNFAVDFFLNNHPSFNNSDYEWTYIPDMVADILEVVNTRARLEKFEQMMQLKALIEDPKIPVTQLSASAKSQVISIEATTDPFFNLWSKQLSADNAITDPPK